LHIPFGLPERSLESGSLIEVSAIVQVMSTPFEDLEYLADYLPEEGESVVVSRRGGDLVCQPVHAESYRDGIADAELYGRLVLANERLNGLSAVPYWSCLFAAVGFCLALFGWTDVGWNGWYLALAVIATAVLGGSTWAAQRRRRFYQEDVRAMLDSQMRRRQINRYVLVGAVRQHPELSTLLDELSRTRDGACS
jgi:hypothetical protein